MSKRSQRHSIHNEKDQSGCVWGLISIFDFRLGRSTQKLLSDKRHGSSRHAVGAGYLRSIKFLNDTDEKRQGNNDGDEIKTSKVEIRQKSVKEFMEKEISSDAAVEQERSDLEHKGKKRKQTNKTHKVACDIHVHDSKASASLESQESNNLNPVEQFQHFDLYALMEEFCGQIHHHQEICTHHENDGDSFDVQESSNSLKHSHLDELKMQLVQEKMSEVVEAFLNQKFTDAKQFMDALEILNSNKELLAKLLQDSNSPRMNHNHNLREPPSEEVKQNKLSVEAKLSEEEIGNSRQGEKLECRKQVRKQNMHNFFKRKVKSLSRKGSDSPPKASNQIVVLKPSSNSSPQSHYSLRNKGHGGRLNSQFSISEIKRKLKHAMGESRKEKHRISMDGILHKVPSKHQDSTNVGKRIARRESPSQTHLHVERTIDPSTIHESGDHDVASTRADSCQNLTWTTYEYPNQRESNIYIEAKKHLAEMLDNGDEEYGNSSNRQVPRTLGRILCLPEYNVSPVLSPGRDGENSFITAQMRFAADRNLQIVGEDIGQPEEDTKANDLSPSRPDLVVSPCTDDVNKPEIELQLNDSNPETSEELLSGTKNEEKDFSSRGDLSPKGGMEILEITDVVCLEDSNFLDGPSESNSMSLREEEGSSNCVGLDSPSKDQPQPSSSGSFLPSSLVIQKIEALESINDGPERPSPVSVLEPYFLEEVISPASTISQPAELPMQPLQICFEEYESCTLIVTPSDQENYLRACMEDKEPTFEFVRAVLQASDLSLDEFLGKYHSSYRPLNPSLFDDVEFLPGPLCGDRELLFDCINEALVELFEHYLGCSPWVAFVNPKIRPIPVGENLIREVWEGIDCERSPQFLPSTLDQIVGKDMEKARTWMDLRFDTDGIGTEIGEIVLEELIKDAIFDMCS